VIQPKTQDEAWQIRCQDEWIMGVVPICTPTQAIPRQECPRQRIQISQTLYQQSISQVMNGSYRIQNIKKRMKGNMRNSSAKQLCNMSMEVWLLACKHGRCH
jgi:hypothetical protein